MEPVTVIVRRRVKAGSETAYEGWLERLTSAAREQSVGYLGADFLRPAAVGGEYRSVLRFDSVANLEAFEASQLRKDMLAEATPLFAADAIWDRMTGLEFWFDPPPGTRVPQPSPHRMALILVVVVFSLVMILTLTLGPFMAGWPMAARTLVIATIQVGLMTYLIMPRLSRLLAGFIYPKTKVV